MTESILSLAMSLLMAAFAMFVIDNYVTPRRGLRYFLHAMVIIGQCAWLLRVSGIAWPAFGLLAKVLFTTAFFGMLMWAVNGGMARRRTVSAMLNAGVLLVASLFLVQIFSI
jgi:hypothetical protein